MKLKLPKDILIIHIIRISLLLLLFPILFNYLTIQNLTNIFPIILLLIIFNELIKIVSSILIYKYNKDKIIIGTIVSLVEGFIILFILFYSHSLINGGYILILLSLLINALMYDYESVLIEGIVIGTSYFFLNLSSYFTANFSYYSIRSIIIVTVSILNYFIAKKIFNVQNTLITKMEKEQSGNAEDLKNTFTVVASHNLRTPLATIRGYFQLMESENNQKTKEKYLMFIKENINTLSNIIEEILGILTIGEKSEKSTIDIEQTIKEIIKSFTEKTLSRKINIVVEKHSNIPVIEANQYRFKLIMENIIDNAIKYSKDQSTIEIHLSSDVNNVEIIVKDYGIGIEKDKLKTIFEQYSKGSNPLVSNFEGVGLGLFMVKTIIDLETGSINIKSKENEGTEVIIKFPVQNVISSLENL